MKQLFSLMAAMSVLAFSSCQKETQSGPDAEPGFKNLSISVNVGSDTRAVVDGLPAEKTIKKLIVAVYDKDGKYIKSPEFADVTGAISITTIPEKSFPIKLFAVANIELTPGGAWAMNMNGQTWDKTTFASRSSFIFSHKVSVGKNLVKGVTPLVICGEVESVAANAGSVEIPMFRPVIRVQVTNKSTLPITKLTFAGLNAGAMYNATYTATGEKTFTYIDNTSLAAGATGNYYFMPQSNSASISVESTGVATKTKNFPTVEYNHLLPIVINDKSIDFGAITIIVPDKWEGDAEIEM